MAVSLGEQLFNACRQGDIVHFEQIVTEAHQRRRTLDVDWDGQLDSGEMHEGWTPLTEACRTGNAHLVKRLLELGANVNKCDLNGMAPVHWATVSNDEAAAVAVLTLLEDAGANFNVTDNHGNTALEMVLMQPHGSQDSEIYRRLEQPRLSEQLLMLAERSEWDDLERVIDQRTLRSDDFTARLRGSGAFGEYGERAGFSLIHLVAAAGKHEILASMIRQGGITDLDLCLAVRKEHHDIDSAIITPAHLAAAGGHTKVLKFLNAGAMFKGAACGAVFLVERNGVLPRDLAANEATADLISKLVSMGSGANTKSASKS